jgi:putative FmdB family regulatory protein
VPLYDFRCRACGHVFEFLVRPNPPEGCAKCNATDLERLPSVFAAATSERHQAAVNTKIKKEAHRGRLETAESDREIEHHRHEDH